MPKYNDHRVIDLSRPAILSVEEFPRELKALLEVDEKNKIVTTNLMQLDYISRNNSMYSGEDVVKSLEAATWIEELRRQGKWMGEFEHPPRNTSIERFMLVDNDRVSHRIRKWWRKGDMLQGVVDFNPLPLGPRAWSWVSTGSNPSFSVRIYTKNYIEKTDSSGKKYLLKRGTMIPVTFDFVAIPGFYSCYAANPDNYDIANQTAESLRLEFLKDRELVSDKTFESWTFDFTKDNFKELVLSQESAPLLQEAIGIDLKTADIVYTTEGLIMIKPLGRKDKILFPASTYELNRVLLDSNSTKRSVERLKNNVYSMISKNNSESGLDSESYRVYENNLSAEEMVHLEPKISVENYNNTFKTKLQEQIIFAAYSFRKNLSESFENLFADSTLAAMNRSLDKKKKKPLSREDLENAVLNLISPINCIAPIDNLGKNKSASKYISIFKVDNTNTGTPMFWFKRCLKDTVEKTRESLVSKFGQECMIKLFTQGDFGFESKEFNLDSNRYIQVKVNLRIE